MQSASLSYAAAVCTPVSKAQNDRHGKKTEAVTILLLTHWYMVMQM